MKVDDAEDVVEFRLPIDPVSNRPEVISEMEIARWLNS